MTTDAAVLEKPADAPEAKTEDVEEPKTALASGTDLSVKEPTGEDADTDEDEGDEEDAVLKAREEAAEARGAQKALEAKEAEAAEAKRVKDAADKKAAFRTHSATYQTNLKTDATTFAREILGDPEYQPTEAQLKRFLDRYQAHNRDTQEVSDFHADNRWLDDTRALLPKDKHADLEALTDKEGTTTRDVLSFLAENVATGTKAVKALVNGLEVEDVQKSYPALFKRFDDRGEQLYKNGLAGKTRDGKKDAVRGEPRAGGGPASNVTEPASWKEANEMFAGSHTSGRKIDINQLRRYQSQFGVRS